MSGGKGGGSGGGTSQVYQSSLPEYARPYYEQLMGQASAAAQTPYQQYQGDLVAGMNGNELNALSGYYGLGNSTGTNFMTQAGNAATAQAKGGNNYTPNQVNSSAIRGSNVQAGTVNPGSIGAGMTSTGQFDSAAARQYMNPYMQNVVDIQKNAAVQDYQKQQVMNHNDMASRGAFGGTRQAIIDAEAQKALAGNLNDIQANGLNTSYNNAMSQFNTDQGRSLQSQQGNQNAGLQASLANQSTNLAGQQFNVQQNLAAQQANQANNMATQQFNAQQNMVAQQANQNAGLQANAQNVDSRNQGINAMGNIGQTLNAQGMQALGQIGSIGAQQRDITQQQMNAAYNNYQNAINYPQNQIGWYSQILHGTPVQANSTATQLTPSPSMATQLAGLGALGLGAGTSR